MAMKRQIDISGSGRLHLYNRQRVYAMFNYPASSIIAIFTATSSSGQSQDECRPPIIALAVLLAVAVIIAIILAILLFRKGRLVKLGLSVSRVDVSGS